MRETAAAARDRGREQVHFDRPEAIPGDDVRLMATIIARCADKSPYLSPSLASFVNVRDKKIPQCQAAFCHREHHHRPRYTRGENRDGFGDEK